MHFELNLRKEITDLNQLYHQKEMWLIANETYTDRITTRNKIDYLLENVYSSSIYSN